MIVLEYRREASVQHSLDISHIGVDQRRPYAPGLKKRSPCFEGNIHRHCEKSAESSCYLHSCEAPLPETFELSRSRDNRTSRAS